MYYRRKIDAFLQEWKADPNHKPLIVKGAGQNLYFILRRIIIKILSTLILHLKKSLCEF